jgi:hypothetical protein
VADAAQSTSAGASETHRSASELAMLAQELSRLVERFQLEAEPGGDRPRRGNPSEGPQHLPSPAPMMASTPATSPSPPRTNGHAPRPIHELVGSGSNGSTFGSNGH